MAKLLANKQTKELLTEPQISERGLQKGEFSPTWQGRMHVINPEKSFIARQLGIEKKGEYAIKVR